MHLNKYQVGIGTFLLFQHGLAANASQIENLVGSIDEKTVVSFDCPGHGLSMLEQGTIPSFDLYAQLIIKELDRLGAERFIAGGLSMGAGIALNIALRYPERVSGLILHRPAWLHYPNPRNLEILLDALPYMKRNGGEDEFKLTDSMKEIDSVNPKAAKSVLGIFSSGQQKNLGSIISNLVGDKPFDRLEDLHKIKCPILITGCDDDPLHPFEIAETLHRQLKNSQLEKLISRYIDDKGHKMAFRTYLADFIKKHDL